MMSIYVILILILKLCLGQDYPQLTYKVSQENDYSRTTKSQNDKSFNNLFDWKNNYDNNIIIPDANYFVVASRMVRPGQVYKVSVTVYKAKQPISVRASIQRNGVELASDLSIIKEGIQETLLLLVPATSVTGDYKLRVEGLYDGIIGGYAFNNETRLNFSQRSMTIFIQTDKPIYKQSDIVYFRAIPINTELKAFDNPVDVYILDPNRFIMRRWLSRQSNFGCVSLNYEMSDQPVFGEWTIQVVAQGQIEEATFLVEEYYQTRFEVNVTMAAYFLDSDKYLSGYVMANYTSGGPVKGNLTLKATIRPLKNGFKNYDGPVIEKYLSFDEAHPSWYPKQSEYSRINQIPHLQWFYGVYKFRYPLSELQQLVSTLEETEVTITATVGERYLNEIVEGYSTARFFNSSVRVAFLGGSPQVFKPAMPFSIYITVSHHDGSPLDRYRLLLGRLDMSAEVVMKSGGRRTIDTRTLKMSTDHEGVFEMKLYLRTELGLENDKRASEVLKDIESMKIYGSFKDMYGERSTSELLLLTHYSPSQHHLKVWTSTKDAKVGQFIVFHVQSNYYLESFDYILLSKGLILLTGQEVTHASTIRTFAVTLSAEMAPAATILVYHVGKFGDVVADSLTFPVNGISRNNFTVFINDRKSRSGKKVEVAIYGEPGAYVGLSSLDYPFYGLQAGNELTYAKILTKMERFDEDTNGTIMHTWLSHEGSPDEIVYFPSSTFGIDANRTFEFAGVVVFTDVILPRRMTLCNKTLGYAECLSGRCYLANRKCDGHIDCDDGTDEALCPLYNRTEFNNFRKFRYNHLQRHYDNVWMWRDINIGPHGRFIFDIDVPYRPANWMITAFSLSPTKGFGMIKKPIEYVGVLPFFMNVEMPTNCKEGEQIGIRVTVFNNQCNSVEAVVILLGSESYKFVHVEEDGIVNSYNPRTSHGDQQIFVYIKAQDAETVYLPVVPTKLGDITITIEATSLIASDRVTRNLHVDSDGVPQYRHLSMILDLSNRAYVFQYLHVNVTETPIIPYSIDRYYVYGSNKAHLSIVGDVVGPIFPTMPVNATSLLNLPMDAAEQTMFSFAANLYTTIYMRFSNQRDRTLEKQSFYNLNIGYQRMLSFMNNDGSFSLFRSDWNMSYPSVWLTSYCARVFQEANFYEWENFIFIDPQVISKALMWVLKHQTEEGSFYDVTWFPDRKVNSSMHRSILFGTNRQQRFTNISLTAQVLITLTNAKDLSGGLGSKLAQAESRAVKYLEKNMNLLNMTGEPYEIALVTYALMLTKSSFAEYAFTLLSRHARRESGLMYWGKEFVPSPPSKMENQKPFLLPRLPYKFDSINIETTAYALLVYVARKEPFIDDVVKWLNSQRLTDGGWASTQDTAIAMKALIEYTNRNRLRDVFTLTVTVEATALSGKTKILKVNSENIARLQKIEIPQAWGTVKVQAKGSGYAILQMSVQYNVDVAKFQTTPPEQAFGILTRADFHGRNQSHITYLSCQKWTYIDESPRSGLAVLDVAIPTGYIMQQQNLDAYVLQRTVPNLQRARFFPGKLLFYFDYLDESETCVKFTVERWYPVANMSRYLPVRVYDYYAPERFNETIFDALPTYLLNICEVCGSSQCPYCPIFNNAVQLYVPIKCISIAIIIVINIYNNLIT
ncbi:hypothetical protein QTP88_014463 [Uroleucon formosanum]